MPDFRRSRISVRRMRITINTSMIVVNEDGNPAK
jgi:hypothetical protein